MGIHPVNGIYQYHKRVPKRFQHVDGRGIVRKSLHTRNRAEAEVKAVAVEEEFFRYWEALAAGRRGDANTHFAALRGIAHQRGFSYAPAATLADSATLEEILSRLARVEAERGHHGPVADALLGAEPVPRLKISELPEFIEEQEATSLVGFSDLQLTRWRRGRIRAATRMVEVLGDKDIAELNREDGLAFRDFANKRIADGRWSPAAANRMLTDVCSMVNRVDDLMRLGLGDPFGKLRFKVKEPTPIPFTMDFLTRVWARPGAFDGTNDEVRDAALALVNTGLRPSELLGTIEEEIILDSDTPHLIIRPRDGGPHPRKLKNAISERKVPLSGISLEAMRRRPKGFERYFGNADRFSAAVNKFCRANGLFEAEGQTLYHLRHSFEDRLTSVECPERIKADLMGHKLDRQRYGMGATLAHKAEWVARVAVMSGR